MRRIAIVFFFLCLVTSRSATTWFVTTSGNDSHGCTNNSTDACLSINRALAVASAGDLVSLGTGTYGSQTISQSKTTPGVTVQCVSQYNCTLGNTIAGGAWYTLQDLIINPGNTAHNQGYEISGANISFTNVKLHGSFAAGYVDAGVANFSWTGGEWGEAGNLGARNCANGDGYYMYLLGDTSITGISLKNILVQPQHLDPTTCAGDPLHMETIRIDGNINGFTADQMTFLDGMQDNTGTIFLTNFRGGPPTNITFQNSYFGSDGNVSFIDNSCGTVTMKYNTITSGVTESGVCAGHTWVGNAGYWLSFQTCTGTHTKNVWQDSQSFSCGTDTVVIGTRFNVDSLGIGPPNGYTIQNTSSPLYNAAQATCTPAYDILGTTRPQSTACDAGADEFGTSASSNTSRAYPGKAAISGVTKK